MTNEEAIEHIKLILLRDRNNELHFVSHDEEIALNIAIKAIEERPTGEWIPVSERLPEFGDEVLTYSNSGFIEKQRLENPYYKHWENQENAWSEFDEVIAWMPMPKPYKKGEEE